MATIKQILAAAKKKDSKTSIADAKLASNTPTIYRSPTPKITPTITPTIKASLPSALPQLNMLPRISKQGEQTTEALKLAALKPLSVRNEDRMTLNVLPRAIATGGLKVAESLVKAPAYGLAGLMTSQGDSKRYEETNKYVPSPSTVSPETLRKAQAIADATSKFNLYHKSGQDFISNTENTIAGFKTPGNRILGQTAIAGGQMIPVIATGGLLGAAAGLGVMGTGVYSSSMDESTKKGLPVKTAAQNALGQTVIEVGTERMFGGIPGLGKGFIGTLISKSVPLKTASKLVSQISKSLVGNRIAGVLGEGIEEVASSYLSPFVERATIDPNASDATIKEMAESFVSGALLSMLLQGGAVALTSGKKISKPEDIQTLTKEEKQEFDTELERLAYESNVRKGKITPQGEVIQSYSSTWIADNYGLPSPTGKTNNYNIKTHKLKSGKGLSGNEAYKAAKLIYINKINELTDYIENYKPKGTTTSYTDQDGYGVNPLTDIVYGANRINTSNNDIWYQDFWKDNGRKPTKGESREIATNLVDDSLSYEYNDGLVYDGNFNELVRSISPDSEGTPLQILQRAESAGNKFELGDIMLDSLFPDQKSGKTTSDIPKLLPKPTDIYSQAKGQREIPRSITRNELPRASEIINQQPTLQPQLNPQNLPIAKSNINLGTELPRANVKPLKPLKPFTDNGSIAEVLTSSKQTQSTLGEKVSDLTGELRRKFTDSGDTVTKIAKITNDKGLYHYYNNAKQARRRAEFMMGEAQADINGDKVGKSIKDIFAPIRNKGEDYYKDFTTYMLHEHNIDRMAQNKPVFGESVTAEMSRIEADKLLKQYPEFANFAQEIYNYNHNQMQYRIDSGLVSQEQAQIWDKMYPHYVPTFRANPKSKGIITGKNMAAIEKTVKTAKGSNLAILPLHENMSKQTMQAVEAANKNIFGNRLIENASEETSRYIQDVQNVQEDIDLDTEIPELKNHFRVYKNGEAYQVQVDDTLFEGLQALADTGKAPNAFIKGVAAGNKGFKQLITGWSLPFLVRNGARDIQDVGLYSKNLKEFAKQYPEAIKEMAANGEMWQQYKALGGSGSSFFDYLKGYKDDPSWLRKNTIDKIEELNMAIEQLPRFTEFLATVSKGNGSYDNLMEAMYNSADVTVNFGRSGTWGKTLNSTFVPFFNPSMQGASKLVRKFTETKGVKEWTELTLKIVSMGIAPSIINAMMYMGDPDYDELNDRDKDTNFLFKIGDNEWIRIPKGRVLSLFGATAQRTMRALKGEKDAYKGLLGVMADQTAPISPTESNILSPMFAVRNNKSWYGGKIEPQRLEKFSPGLRYDETTTSLSKFVGKKINYSPKKLDYLLDAYSGIIGDTAMPMMTPRAETNPLIKAFTIDGALSNKLSQQFYDIKDKIYYAKNDVAGKDENDTLNSYMNKQNGVVSDIYDTIRKTEGGLLSDKEKRAKVRELRIKVNNIYKEALGYIHKNSKY